LRSWNSESEMLTGVILTGLCGSWVIWGGMGHSCGVWEVLTVVGFRTGIGVVHKRVRVLFQAHRHPEKTCVIQ
jgi:hypothetical protein